MLSPGKHLRVCQSGRPVYNCRVDPNLRPEHGSRATQERAKVSLSHHLPVTSRHLVFRLSLRRHVRQNTRDILEARIADCGLKQLPAVRQRSEIVAKELSPATQHGEPYPNKGFRLRNIPEERGSGWETPLMNAPLVGLRRALFSDCRTDGAPLRGPPFWAEDNVQRGGAARKSEPGNWRASLKVRPSGGTARSPFF